jgi:hypothetical protein
VTDSGTRAEAAESSSARQLATAFPVFVAISVAFLYSLGAIELVGQLREDHVDALAALPLVPLQQVLGRGIWVATIELPWMLAVAVLGIVIAQGVERVESRRERLGVQALFVILGVGGLFVFMPLLLIRMLITVAIGLVVAWPFRERIMRGLSFNEIVAASAVFAVLYAASGAVVMPEHLAVAKLKLESGSTKGALVAFDGSSWYLNRNGKIDAIPARAVLSSRIERIGRRHYKPLWRF